MSQVTIYMDDETEAKTRAAARAAGVSLSRWIAEVLRSRVGSTWPADVAALEGSWGSPEDSAPTEPGPHGDLPREPL